MATNNTRQAMWIGLGSFFSFLVGIVSPMILSRLFTKDDYGTYKQVMYVYQSLILVFSLGLPRAYAYFLPRYERQYSKDIINKITHLFLIMGILFSAFVYGFSDVIARLLNNDQLSLALKVFSPTPFLLLQTFGLEGIYASFKKTEWISIYTVTTRVFTVVLTVLPVFLYGGNYIHALIGFDVASLITFIIALLMMYYPTRYEHHEKSNLTYRQILSFSLPLLSAALWGLVISSACQFFISRYYGTSIFADFSNGFMEMPFATMVVSAIAAVLLPRLSELDSDNMEKREQVIILWRSALIKSAKIIFPILIFAVFFARLIMICLYGDTYGSSGVYFQIKNISSLFYIIPFAPIMLAIGKSKAFANIHMVIAFLIVFLEFACVKIIDSPVALAVTSEVCQVFKLYLMMRVVANYAHRHIMDLIPTREMLLIILACILSALTTYGLSLLISANKFVLVTLLIIVFCSIYYMICIILKISYKEIVVGLLPKFNKQILRLVP